LGLTCQGQIEAVLGYLVKTRWPTRNRVIFLLSVKAGLRAKEIARLTWRMVTDARGQIGQAIYLENTTQNHVFSLKRDPRPERSDQRQPN
jgi:integrase